MKGPITRLLFLGFLVFLLYLPETRRKIKISIYRNKLLKFKYYNTIQKYYTLLRNDKDLKSIRTTRALLILIGVLMIFCGILISLGNLPIGIAMIFGGVFLYIVKYKGDYDDIFKRKIIPLAVKEYDCNFIFSPNGEILEHDYDMTWKEQFDKYYSEDKIDGTVNGCPFIVADVHTKYKVENTHSSGIGKNKTYSTSTYYKTGFEGIVAKVRLDVPLNFGLQICNRHTIGINTRPLKNVKIDNDEFSKICRVFSDNEFKTYQFLKPSLTNKLIDLYNYYRMPFDIKFSGNYVWFRFKDVKFFKANIDDPVKEAYDIALYFEIINFVKDLTKEMVEAMKDIDSEV